MRFIGNVVVLLVVLGLAGYLLGWIDFEKNKKGVSVEVDRDKIQQDLDKVKEGVSKVGKNINEAVQGKSVTGKVAKVEGESLTVAPASGPVVTFHLKADTKITRAGKAIGPADLQAGEGVKVAYKEEADKNVAISVEALP